MQKIILIVLAIFVIVGTAYYLGKNSSKIEDSPKQVACTMEAKICSDGSSVGRTGSNCEFAECSIKETDKTENLNFIFKYGVSSDSQSPRNILNTFNETYTKDMIMGSDVTINLSLSKEELEQINQKIAGINLLEFPDNFSDPQPSCKMPFQSYNLTVTSNSITKQLS